MNKSFTLIEILVVIVVIGILSAFILVGMSSISESANISKGQVYFNSIDNSLLLSRASTWKFDESSASDGSSLSDSWGTNIATLHTNNTTQNKIKTTGCISNNCIELDGDNDYLTVTEISSSSFTVCFWIKRYSIAEQIIAGKTGNNYLVDINTNGRIYTANLTAMGSFSYNVNLNMYYNFCVSRDGTTVKFFINGKNEGTIVLGTNDPHLINQIGCANSGSWDFHGIIDDFRYYSNSISTSIIKRNYYLGLSRLFQNNQISLDEFNQRIADLKSNLVAHE